MRPAVAELNSNVNVAAATVEKGDGAGAGGDVTGGDVPGGDVTGGDVTGGDVTGGDVTATVSAAGGDPSSEVGGEPTVTAATTPARASSHSCSSRRLVTNGRASSRTAGSTRSSARKP